MNIKLTISWDGAQFSGYQIQPNAVTVQGTLMKAWQLLTGENAVIIGCSRLDAQVHANSFVLNFKSETSFNCEKIIRSLNGILNSHLQAKISVYDCEFVALDFHARYHAVGKHYQYLIWQGMRNHALLTPKCWQVHSKKQIKNLHSIFQEFVGQKDFSAFRAADCSAKNTIKNLVAVHCSYHAIYPEMIVVDFWGDGFLKNMIRNIVGTAVQVSIGAYKENTISEAFIHKDRKQVGLCAPGKALTLIQVYYNKEEFIGHANNYASHKPQNLF